MEETKKLPPAIAALIVIAIIALATAATMILGKVQGEDSVSFSDITSDNNKSQNSVTEPSNSAYKDGTYSAEGAYATPGGRESVSVAITIHDDKIVSSTFTQNARSESAKDFQQRFSSGYQQEVVGKKIDEVSLSRVAGSSLTSSGFNNALEQIKNESRSRNG